MATLGPFQFHFLFRSRRAQRPNRTRNLIIYENMKSARSACEHFSLEPRVGPTKKKKRKEKKRNTVQYNCRAKPKQLPTLTDYGLTAIVALKRLQNGSKKRGGGWWKTGANLHVICFYAESSEFHFQHARQRANSNQQYVHYKARYIKLTHAKGPRAAEMAQRRVLHGRGVGWWHIK